ncbi:MAG: sensor histidine kinase [Sciscionella sp.]
MERSINWLIEQYRSESARALLNKARLAAAQLLVPKQASLAIPRPATPNETAAQEVSEATVEQEGQAQDALAGMCAGVAQRDLNLVDSLLAHLENMEANEDDPDTLARFYRLDHLGTRLRRNAENLRVLAGQEASGGGSETSAIVDVIRAAMSSIEHYRRVEIGWVAALGVVDFAAEDVSRLLAELLDNATAWSPPTSMVTVSAHVTEQGSVLLRVEDAGIGLQADRLGELNDLLSADPMLDSKSIEHMGLAVVRRLAGKHGIRVTLSRRTPHGTNAAIVLPAGLVCEAPPVSWFSSENSAAEPARSRMVRAHGQSESEVATKPRAEEARHAVRPSSLRSSPHSIAATETTAPTETPAETTTEMTRSGLPRRVPHSLRDPANPSRTAQPSWPTETQTDPGAGQEQLIADLTAFSEGEQAAHEVHHVARPRSADSDEGSTNNDH